MNHVVARAVSILISSLLLCGYATSSMAEGDGGYAVVATWPAAGNDKWDYLLVDAPRHRLFVSRATHVQVLDLDSGLPAGQISDTPGAHGIAIAEDLNRGFVKQGRFGHGI